MLNSRRSSATADRPRRVFSRFYARISPQLEAEGMALLRQEMLAGLAGDVVEVGAGNGLNFAHYPSTVTSVIAVEPEPYLRSLATHESLRLGYQTQVASPRLSS